MVGQPTARNKKQSVPASVFATEFAVASIGLLMRPLTDKDTITVGALAVRFLVQAADSNGTARSNSP